MDKNFKDFSICQADELKDQLTTLGFYRDFPTPELLREAQEAYGKLESQNSPNNTKFLPLRPPLRTKNQLIDNDVMDELDCHALETPSLYLSHSMNTLVDYLLQPTESDLEKARVITRWLARCMDEDYLKELPRSSLSRFESVASFLWKLRQKEIDYDELFHVLCEYAGLKCFAVKGCVRNTIKYEIGEDFLEQKKTWTVVLIDGEWRPMDVRWICEAAYGVLKNNWRLIEDEKGKVSYRKAINENQGTFKTHVRFRDFYFLTDPEQFIYDHFPDEERFQLLARPLSYKECKGAASLRSDFFRHNLFVKSHSKNTIVCDDGKLTIVIGMRENKSMAFVYKLYKSKNNKKAIESNASKLDRYVFLERNIDDLEIRVTIRCPSIGRFLFELHGSGTKETHNSLLLTYIIECTAVKYDVKPLPPNLRQEWGPGEDTIEMGMVALTHKKGEVEAEDGDAEIKFNLQRELEFKHNLIRGEIDEPVSNRHILHTVENGQMSINLRLPEQGEYSLNVLAKEKHKKTHFAPACSYLISCNDEPLENREFPKLEEGCHLGPNEYFFNFGFQEENPWPSFINNLVTGEFCMHIKRPKGHYVFANLIFEKEMKTESYDNYVICDTQDESVIITCIFPKHGLFKLSVFTRMDEGKIQLIYIKLIDVVLPTLTGMPFPTTSMPPTWCTGFSVKEPRQYYLLAHETKKVSIFMPEIKALCVKNNSECLFQQTSSGFWEGYMWTGSAESVIELMAVSKKSEVSHTMLKYQVVTKEDSLLIEMKQEQLFQQALDDLNIMEKERNTRLCHRMHQAIKTKNTDKLQRVLARMKEMNAEYLKKDLAVGDLALMEMLKEEEEVQVRKELRKCTRSCDRPGLEYAIKRFEKLKLEEKENDLTSAKKILKKLGGNIVLEDQSNTRSQPATAHTLDETKKKSDIPIHVITKNPTLHIYVTQDSKPNPEIILSTFGEAEPTILENDEVMSVRLADNVAMEKEADEHFAKDKTMVREKLHKASFLRQTETLQQAIDDFKRLKLEEKEGDLTFAEDQLENLSLSQKATKSSLHKETIDALQCHLKETKKRSEVPENDPRDEIQKEFQNLKNMNMVCKKIANAAEIMSKNWNNLIESEQGFQMVLKGLLENSSSLCEEMNHTFELQKNFIHAEFGMKGAFIDLAKSLDELCANVLKKAELITEDLEAARLETEQDCKVPKPSILHHGQKFEMRNMHKSKQLGIKTPYHALRSNALKEIKSYTKLLEEKIHHKLAELHKKMAEFHLNECFF